MPDISRVVFIKSAPEGIRAISLGEELLLHGYQEIMGDDGLNRLTKGTNDTSIVERRYDSLSRLIEEVQDGKSVQYGYDKVGNTTSIRYPNSRLVEREFDLLNRISRVKQGNDIVSTMEFLGRSYRLASKGYQNGDLVKYLYDQGRRLTSSETKNKNQAILQSFGWGYDSLDLKSFEKRIHDGGKGDAFSYDALKRLTNVTFDSPTPETPTATGTRSRAITLDKLDNILKITDNENAMVTEIIGELEGKGKALNQYSKFNDLPLEYDTNGNLSAKGSRLFSYDYRNRLVRSSRGDDAVTFTYDIFGRQTSRTDVSGTLHFFYAGDQKIEERNASGQVTKHYFWGNSIDELLRLDVFNGSSSTPYYVHSDAIGSTTTVTDENGSLVERVRYDAYGVPSFTDALGQSLKKSTIGNTTLFQGREYDYDLALYNYRARYFDPSMGRFLQTDPLGYQDSMNLYQGMNMNPGNFVDPWGTEIVLPDVRELQEAHKITRELYLKNEGPDNPYERLCLIDEKIYLEDGSNDLGDETLGQFFPNVLTGKPTVKVNVSLAQKKFKQFSKGVEVLPEYEKLNPVIKGYKRYEGARNFMDIIVGNMSHELVGHVSEYLANKARRDELEMAEVAMNEKYRGNRARIFKEMQRDKAFFKYLKSINLIKEDARLNMSIYNDYLVSKGDLKYVDFFRQVKLLKEREDEIANEEAFKAYTEGMKVERWIKGEK